MSLSSFFNDFKDTWWKSCAEEEMRPTTSDEKTPVSAPTGTRKFTSLTSVQLVQASQNKLIDREYMSLAPSEKLQYRSQEEKEKLLDMQNASPYMSEKMEYLAQDEYKELIDAKGISENTSDSPQKDPQCKCPCGLFQDPKHWKKKDWVVAVSIGALACVCFLALVGLSSKGSKGRPTFIHVSSRSRDEDDECDKCMDACCCDPCVVPCFKACGVPCLTSQEKKELKELSPIERQRRQEEQRDKCIDECCLMDSCLAPCLKAWGLPFPNSREWAELRRMSPIERDRRKEEAQEECNRWKSACCLHQCLASCCKAWMQEEKEV